MEHYNVTGHLGYADPINVEALAVARRSLNQITHPGVI
jgi:hypothetical protein